MNCARIHLEIHIVTCWAWYNNLLTMFTKCVIQISLIWYEAFQFHCLRIKINAIICTLNIFSYKSMVIKQHGKHYSRGQFSPNASVPSTEVFNYQFSLFWLSIWIALVARWVMRKRNTFYFFFCFSKSPKPSRSKRKFHLKLLRIFLQNEMVQNCSSCLASTVQAFASMRKCIFNANSIRINQLRVQFKIEFIVIWWTILDEMLRLTKWISLDELES